MKLSTRQLRRIIQEEKRKMRRNIRETGHDVDWGGDEHDYHREMGDDGRRHRTGDVDGHYKDYEGPYGGGSDEYHRSGGHRTGDVGGGKYGKGGHYKDYMSENDADEEDTDRLGEEWGSGRELEDPMADDMGGAMHTESTKISRSRLRKIIMEEVKKALRGL